jgi:hypothetical protein
MNDILKKVLSIYEETWDIVEDNEKLEVIEEGGWIVDYKWQYCTIIVKYEGKYYEITQSRSGSPFTDYEYSPSTIIEVAPFEETKVIKGWRPV